LLFTGPSDESAESKRTHADQERGLWRRKKAKGRKFLLLPTFSPRKTNLHRMKKKCISDEKQKNKTVAQKKTTTRKKRERKKRSVCAMSIQSNHISFKENLPTRVFYLYAFPLSSVHFLIPSWFLLNSYL